MNTEKNKDEEEKSEDQGDVGKQVNVQSPDFGVCDERVM